MSASELHRAVGVHAGRDRHDPRRGVQAEEGAGDLGQRGAAPTLPLVPLAVKREAWCDERPRPQRRAPALLGTCP